MTLKAHGKKKNPQFSAMKRRGEKVHSFPRKTYPQGSPYSERAWGVGQRKTGAEKVASPIE